MRRRSSVSPVRLLSDQNGQQAPGDRFFTASVLSAGRVCSGTRQRLSLFDHGSRKGLQSGAKAGAVARAKVQVAARDFETPYPPAPHTDSAAAGVYSSASDRRAADGQSLA